MTTTLSHSFRRTGMRASLFLVGFFLVVPASTQEKKPEKKDEPQIRMAVPFSVPPGNVTLITLRGKKLDETTEVRCSEKSIVVRVVGKGKSAIPDKQDANKAGDTQAEIELTVPPEFFDKSASLTLVTPAGETNAYEIVVDPPDRVIREKEPNNGFRQAQTIAVGRIVYGTINGNQDVDVFRIEGNAGDKLVFEIHAAIRGSLLDSYLLLHDETGTLIKSNDDCDSSADSILEVQLPRNGVYYLSVADAFDTGSSLHVYRLSVRK